MVAAQGGDRRAYAVLLRNCIPVIKAVARNTGTPRDYVDDVVQETLMTLHSARHTYDPGRPFMAWLCVLARRRAIDVLRRHGRNRTREVHAPLVYENYPDAARNPEELLYDASRRALLREAVQSLPPAQREAVQFLALNDQSLIETAAATKRSKAALKVNLHRALLSLRARLLGDGQ
jgi:RNA polymerase sigma-70 factor (ECF subfamily)